MDLQGGLVVRNLISGVLSHGIALSRTFEKWLRKHLPWWLRWDTILALLTVFVEIISAALDKSSPHKLKAAEYSLTMAALFFMLGLADLSQRCYHKCRRRHKDHRPHRHLGWDFADAFGLVSSAFTLICASNHYHYLSKRKKQPIRFSMFPLAFSVCAFCSRIFQIHAHRRPVPRTDNEFTSAP